MQVFAHVPVVPVTTVHQHVAVGGPIWPDFAKQTRIRHCRGNKPRDVAPERPLDMPPVIETAVWGGFLDSHFGHFVADHLPRLPLALRQRPDDIFLFTVDPGMARDALPPWVGQVFDWIGLREDQVHLVTAPVLVGRLWVGVQAEMLPQVAPAPDYLTLIEDWAAALVPVDAPMLYVARTGLAEQGGGVHAGESYVVAQLRRRGVAVLDPAQAPLRDQMAAYAGAGRIIFAEGSALHGRQLLGRLPQDIAVIRRRPDKEMAKASLTPRCRALTYHDVGTLGLMAYWKSGAKRPNPALSLYDVPTLHRVFAGFGIDLATGWSHADFARAAMADVAAWTAWHQPQDKHLAEYQVTLAQSGLVN